MLKSQNIICISSIDWDFIWQGHQEIMTTLASSGNRVLFIENTGVRAMKLRDIPRIKNRIRNFFKGVYGIREERKNLYVYSPAVLPFPYFKIAKWINRHLILSHLQSWVKIMHFHEVIVWVFLPTPLSLEIIEKISSKLIVYYCIDNFKASSPSAAKIIDSEISLLKKADLVFVTSRELYNHCLAYNSKVYLFPFAVNFKNFERIRLAPGEALESMRSLKKPIIGYVGGIHKWVDLKLINELSVKCPDYSFVFVGPVQTDVSLLLGKKNIIFLGKQEHEDLPKFINCFDVAVIPYLITDYTKNVYPTKLNEYLAMGKPVVSSLLPEIVNLNLRNNNLIFTAGNCDEFITAISLSLAEASGDSFERRIYFAKENSWERRIDQMSSLIENEIDAKLELPICWQSKMLQICNNSKRKAVFMFCAVLAAYFALFYTPIVWFLAQPLQISSKLKKADAIIVFAGGVGESGQAGQGYEERVQYAVELRNKGYADSMVFLSGYGHIFKEPVIMKALAVSLGIPPDEIIIEDRPANTYEYIKSLGDILASHGWKTVLLVSSPYHMRRVSLVAKKLIPFAEIVYAPIPQSQFYHHNVDGLGDNKIIRRQITMRQVRALIHEYLGIVYYCLNFKN